MRTSESPNTGPHQHFPLLPPKAGEFIFPAILNTLEEPFFLFNSEFKFVWHNKACNDLYESVSGKPIDCSFDFNELLTAEQQPLFYDHLHKVLAGEKAHFEWRYNKTITKWLSVSLYPFTAENGTFTGICGNMRDITEKKISEFVLLRNTAVLDNISEAVVYTNNEGHIVYINESAENIYAWKAGEVTGRRFLDLIRFVYLDDTRSNAEKIIAEKRAWEGKVTFTRKDGKRIYLLASITPLTDKYGSTIGLIIAGKDITNEELNRRQSLRHQENIDAIINNITEGVLLVDNDLTILSFNERAYALEMRMDTRLHVGKKITDLLPEYRQDTVTGYFESTLEGHSLEYEVLYPDNTWLLINFIPVKNEEGNIHRIIITSRDITERKHAEELIKVNEKKYRTLVNSLSEGVILQTVDDEILTVNKSAAQILGITVDELKQNGFFCNECLIVDENETEISRKDFFFKKNGKANQFKNKVIGLKRKDHTQWLKLNAAAVTRLQENEPNAVVLSFEDITEQKRISAEMEILSMVAKETDNAVCILHPGGEVTWVNEGLTRLTGYSAEEIIGTKSRPMFIGPDSDMNVYRKMAYLRENGLAFKEEVVLYTKSREKKWVLIHGQPIRDSNGVVSRYFSLVTDITDEKKVMQEMEVLSMVAKETSNSVIIFENASGSDILWVNEGFTRVTGYSLNDIVGKNAVEVLTGPATDQSVLINMRRQIGNNLPYMGELLIYTKDGNKRLHQVSGQPIKDADGRVTKYFAIGTDITEHRRLEEERLQKEVEQQKEITRITIKIQESERNELGKELHDNINQILGAVKLQLSFCVSADAGETKPVLVRCVENLQEAMTEIRHLSHKMVMPRFSKTTLQHELDRLISTYRTAAVFQLEVAEWKEEKIPPTIKETFFRIAQEQLNNIQKHARADEILIRLKSDTRSALLFIKDNGIGFDTGRSEKGIGISNMINRAEAYNGTCRFASEPGRGCSVSVSIPLAGGG